MLSVFFVRSADEEIFFQAYVGAVSSGSRALLVAEPELAFAPT